MEMESKYAPLTTEQFIQLKEFIYSLGAYLPEDKAGYVWGNYNTIRAVNEPQPCTCSSSGALWKGAVDFLHNWIKERE